MTRIDEYFKRKETWHRWFAYVPVTVNLDNGNKRMVWWKHVMRRASYWSVPSLGYGGTNWEYKLMGGSNERWINKRGTGDDRGTRNK